MTTSREFAIQVTQKLQSAGYTALWAGGCVRDQLVGKAPKDYDVATNATPEQVRELFGKKRTLAIGESFGVITVLGPKSADPIEVATFRRDTGYSDGRRPDAVEFTDAREDAIRRDFTINGMFFDPIKQEVIDFVGGQEDLQRRVVRAIGDPHERIAEDKLRMLRAIRFAAVFDFELHHDTLLAVQQHVQDIKVVSGERIGAELRRMFNHSNRAVAVRLLSQSKLLPEILPGGERFDNAQVLGRAISFLERLPSGDFPGSVCILLRQIDDRNVLEKLFDQWKLSNDELKSIGWVLRNISVLSQADSLAWSVVQPLLVQNDAQLALNVLQAETPKSSGAGFCRERLTWAKDRLDPAPFLDGKKLQGLGIKPGPLFGKILTRVRVGQLDGEITSQKQAEEIAVQLAESEAI